MQGKLTLSKALTDCKVGESKEITLLVTPTKNDADGFEADVDEVVDYEEERESEKPKPEPMEGDGMGKRMAPAARKAASYA